MFVRFKKNKSGSVTIQIIDKSNGKYEVKQTIGSASELSEIAILKKKALLQIESLKGQAALPFDKKTELEFADTFINHIDSLLLIGPELLLGKLFDEIGFNAIADDLFRQLVITRLVYPVSKLKTVDYLFKYRGIEKSVYSIYRYLDKLQSQQIRQVQDISLKHTLKLFGGKIAVVFYDVTTLYFEASDEDDLLKMGFSKDGKHSQPQILVGLLVSTNGYALDYEIFEGNKYEGETLLPVIEHFAMKHKPEQLIVVADAGLLSNNNIVALQEKNYQYILGARIKNETKIIEKEILKLKLKDKETHVLHRNECDSLINSYKEQRAKKDAYNHKRGLEKLEKKVASGKLTKQTINNKGYNKYLKLESETRIKIDYEKYKDDAKWDELKGYRTNTSLSKEEVIDRYNELWAIEKTFRISKSDLQVRPIYHRLKRRIEAHICISFTACKIYKELERQLKEMKSDLSPERAIDILKTIYKVTFQTPYSNTFYTRLLLKTDEQQKLVSLFKLQI